MFSALCLITSAAVLFFVLRFRVHVHVTYTRTSSGTRPRKKGESAARSVSAPPSLTRLTTARRPAACSLANLGGGGNPAPPVSLSVQMDASDDCGGDLASEPRYAVQGTGSKTRHTAVAPFESDLVSALVNLGSKPAKAKEAAARAMFHQDADFTTALRRAIDYASRSNAA